MKCQTVQNTIALEQYYFKKMIERVWTIENIKVHYFEAIIDLIFQEFSALINGI